MFCCKYRLPDRSLSPSGAAHHDDLIYLFTLPAAFPAVPLNSADDRIVQRMVALWYNFARFGCVY